MTQITDHFPQFLIVRHASKEKKKSYLSKKKVLNDFANLDLSFLNDSALDVNAKFNRFLSSLDKLVKTHAPLKKLPKGKY